MNSCPRARTSAPPHQIGAAASSRAEGRPALPVAPALELRLPAAAAPDDPVRRETAASSSRRADLRRATGRTLDVSTERSGVHRRACRTCRPALTAARQPRDAARAASAPHRARRASPQPVLWYYTPMALTCSRATCRPSRVVYDCMDELSGVRRRAAGAAAPGARAACAAPTSSSPAARACTRPSATSTRNVHPFPSSVDVAHFAQARRPQRGARRSARHPAPAARLLRRDRRAHGPAHCSAASPRRARTGTSC